MMANYADSQFLWVDGRITPYKDAQVHLLSHTLHYGTGAFEGIRAYKTKSGHTAVFRLDEHMRRFIDSIRVLGCELDYDRPQLADACLETIRANQFSECYIRPIAYLDDAVRGLKLPPNPRMHVAIAAWRWGKYMGEDGHLKGVRVLTSTFRRPPSSTYSQAKLTGNYIASVLARREATQNGMDEAILLDADGFVGEGSGENIFMIKNGTISTPQKGPILPGITRDSTMEIAKYLGYPVQEKNLTPEDLQTADEVFFTGTAVEITPIREIDRKEVGNGKPGPITLKLMEFFFRVVNGEEKSFQHWLSPL